MSRVDFWETPEPGLATIAFLSSHTRPAFTLFCFGIAGIRVRSESIASAERRTTSVIGALSRGFTIGATAIPTVLTTLMEEEALVWNKCLGGEGQGL